jgi:hypothetical protein
MTESEQEQGASLRRQFFKLRTLLAFLASFIIIYLFLSRLEIDLAQTWEIIRNANLALYVLALVVFYMNFPIRGLRWQLLLKNVGFREEQGVHLPTFLGLARFISMGWFANCILPAKLGDAYRAYLVKRSSQASFSKTAGTVLAERVIDVVVIFLLLIVAAVGVLQGQATSLAINILQIGLAMLVLLGVGLILMWRLGGFLHRLLPLRFQGIYQLFHEGTFHSFRNLPPILLLSVLVWLIEATRLYLVTLSLGVDLSLFLILFVALADALLVGIPFVPGGLGLVEAGITALLMIAVSKEQAASVALLDRSLSYWSVLVLGAILHLWSLRSLRARRDRLHGSS